jgi:sugar lactone lactonase YvrE
MLGFASADLGASGSPTATVAAKTAGAGGFAFDAAGNLWVVGGTSADPPLARYPASSLGTSGTKIADVTIDHALLRRGVPGPVALAFDASGGLWVSVVYSKQILYYPGDLVPLGGGSTPTKVVRMDDAPAGLALDSAQNLWVASGAGTVLRFDAARLTDSVTGADLEVTAMTPPPVIGALPSPSGLAFDAAGNLWVNYDGTLARLDAAGLADTGATTVTPDVQITMDVLSLPQGVAFDEGGGLWLAYTAGKLARLGPTQLTSSGSKAPEIVIASPDFGYATWVGIYPAPAALPLYHRLP